MDCEVSEDVNDQQNLGRVVISWNIDNFYDQKFISQRPVSFWDSYWAAPRLEPGLRVVSTCQVPFVCLFVYMFAYLLVFWFVFASNVSDV